MPTLPTNPDGSLREFDAGEIDSMDIKRRGVRDHTHVTYNFGPDGAGCTRKFSCEWSERFNAQIYFVGAAKTYTTAGGVFKISRLVPQVDPEFSNWICTKCEITGFVFDGTVDAGAAGSEPLPGFERAELLCTYEMVPFNARADDAITLETERYVTKPGYPGSEVTVETDYIGLPGGILQYATADGTSRPAGVPIPFAVGFTEGKSKFKVVWRRVPLAAWGEGTTLTERVLGTESTRGYIGAVNRTLIFGYGPLRLQLLGVEQRLLPDPTGMGYAWDLAYILSDKPVPHGQLGFYYHSTGAGALAGSLGGTSGYHQVLRPPAGQTEKNPADIGDADSLFHVRSFYDLFIPGAV